MMKPRRVSNVLFAAFVFLAAGAICPAYGSVTLLVNVDTSSVAGTYGYLDLQFNPGNMTSQKATASILNFMTDGILDPTSIQTSGDFTGTLPGPLTAMNDTSFNEYLEGLTFGSKLSFVLNLSGPAIDSPNGTATAGTSFGLGFLNSTQTQALLTNDPSGLVAQVDINLDGSVTATTFPNASGGPSVATIQSTPEPSMFRLMPFVLAALLYIRSRVQQRA